ncbi:MAG: hypothetical protein O2973_10360 [Gemmatimonadetes bacterium]|nr:hypothetical protein [Gemmatimonadota bacterium]
MAQHFRLVASTALCLTVAACATDAEITEVSGGCVDAYTAQVCTWARTQGGTLLEVGATVPLASIENAPADDPMVWPPVAIAVVDIPEAARAQSGFAHLAMYWEAHGHPPGPYLTPHFDFHFYSIPSSERMAIGCDGHIKPAESPAAYATPDIPLPPDMAKLMGVDTLVGLCVPQMGMHALLVSEMESSETFRGTMVIGYNQGQPVFIEPMLTKTVLMEKKSFDLAIPEIPGIGAHPTKFHAEYDAAAQTYRFTFSAFAPSP